MHLLISIFSVACFLSMLVGIKNKYLTYVRNGARDIINMIFHNHKSTLLSLPPPISVLSHSVFYELEIFQAGIFDLVLWKMSFVSLGDTKQNVPLSDARVST